MSRRHDTPPNKGKVNCKHCTRWRPVSDFQPYWSYREQKEYIKRICRVCKKQKDKDRYLNFDLSQRRRLKERTREYAAARRRRQGVPVREISKKGYGAGRVASRSTHFLDPAPLLAMLGNRTHAEVAKLAGVDVRRVQDWRRGNHGISIDAADRLSMELGTHLSILYPEED